MTNATAVQIFSRLDALEKEVRRLKRRVPVKGWRKSGWKVAIRRKP